MSETRLIQAVKALREAAAGDVYWYCPGCGRDMLSTDDAHHPDCPWPEVEAALAEAEAADDRNALIVAEVENYPEDIFTPLSESAG